MSRQDYEHFVAGLDEDAGVEVASIPVATCARSLGESGQYDSETLPKSRVVLTCGADLTPQPVQWLWPDWLALGKFHLLAGAPGQGKTTIAMFLAATVTLGGRWPDGTRCCRALLQPGRIAGGCILWTASEQGTQCALSIPPPIPARCRQRLS